jgi:hypothetical protein
LVTRALLLQARGEVHRIETDDAQGLLAALRD